MDLFLFIAYSLSQGIREAGVFSDGVGQYMKDHHSYDIHRYFVMARSVVWVTFLLMSFLLLKESPFHLLDTGLRGISFLLVFSFFRDGAYNLERKRLDDNMPYTYLQAWTYSSKTSTSKFDFKFWQRLLMLIIAGVLYYNTI